MVQNQDLCPWCCDWTGAGSLASCSLSVSFSLAPSRWGERRREMAGERFGCWSASLHSNSFVFIPPLPTPTPFFPPEEPGCRLAGEPVHLQTRPLDLASPFIPSHPSYSPVPYCLCLTHIHIYTFTPHSLPLCVGTEDWGQAARQAGGLVCGTVLISTGVWRLKSRYLPPQPPFSKSPHLSPSSSLPLSVSLEVASIMLLASPGLWRMSLPAVFFMDGCQPLPISSVRCHFLIYSHLSLFPHLPPFIC